MFDIKILGFNFYHKYVDNVYPVVEMEARYEDDFLGISMFEFERDYDAYDWIFHRLDGTLDEMIKNFVDELWKEFHKGISKVYEIRLYITLPIRPTALIRQHIDNECKRRLAVKREEDKFYRELCNSRYGIISHDMRHMYPLPIIPEPDKPRHIIPESYHLDTDVSILDTCRYIHEIDKDRAKAKEKIKEYEKMKIENVIFNDPATIVFWRDGSKTVVKAKDEPYDPEKGLAMAIAKKVYGNEGNYYNEFKKFIKDVKEEKNEQ